MPAKMLGIRLEEHRWLRLIKVSLIVLVFFFLSPQHCFEFVCEGRVRGEEDNCIV